MNMPAMTIPQGTAGDAEGAGGTTTIGMKAVDATDDKQKSSEN